MHGAGERPTPRKDAWACSWAPYGDGAAVQCAKYRRTGGEACGLWSASRFAPGDAYAGRPSRCGLAPRRPGLGLPRYVVLAGL